MAKPKKSLLPIPGNEPKKEEKKITEKDIQEQIRTFQPGAGRMRGTQFRSFKA